jgi:dipeptidyl aminopeptidase/acylaminoacyl peptidase
MDQIESFLSARLFLAPQLHNGRIFFLSNLSGKISLYRMNFGGSVPEPLLPPDIALQNPYLMEGYSFYVFTDREEILVMIDTDGDEIYKPNLVPIDGGYPEPIFTEDFADFQVYLTKCFPKDNIVYFTAAAQSEQMYYSYQAQLEPRNLQLLANSPWGADVDGVSADHSQIILVDQYTFGDHVVYLWKRGEENRQLLIGTPLDDRQPGQDVSINSIMYTQFTQNDGLLFYTSLFSDRFGLGYLKLSDPDHLEQVRINGIAHEGDGEFDGLHHVKGERYSLKYNIDGCSWIYEGFFDESNLTMELEKVICGGGKLPQGVVEEYHHDENSDTYIFSFSTATSPAQIYTVNGRNHDGIQQHTNECVLGIPQHALALGEDASYISHDGTRISARLYLPSSEQGTNVPYPLVYYIHGGPQSQEKPDFSWFSMPLIQLLTIRGFAVFVPNVRGSTGYGLSYMKEVDRDWGGKDRLDHVYAMENILPADKRIDTSRSGVVGRSYGGYMTLTLAGRHPDLWSAAVDMFGPYDLLTFFERMPEPWKPYFTIAIGDPIEDKDFIIGRSPRTHLNDLSCPLLVIQGKNDPRVVEEESRDLVENLRKSGKDIEYLMFENEGHDVLKYENRVVCYNAIVNFFEKNLKP